MKHKLDKSIGGYQGLDLPFIDAQLDQVTARTNSARSAIKVILKSIDAKKVWLPAYICDAVVDAVKDLDIAFAYYNLSPTFDVDTLVQLGKGEYILIVDYFGTFGDSVKRSLNRFGHANTIVDCSQAYFSEHVGALATVWSPRKFFGLPDGGLLYSDDPRIKQPQNRDNTSETRMGHLIGRLTNSPETAYQKFVEAEQAVAGLPVQGMSELTERLLFSTDHKTIKIARARNARHLHEHLSKYNKLDLNFDNSTAPLCYPFLPNVKVTSRLELIKNRVFVPCYWPEVLARVEEGSFEWDLVTYGLFLPCDQRYSDHEMDRLISLLAIE
ncbi:hypothetical protein KDX31_15385 [Amphritea atlantica]|uniref:dTDP-4-amino-4,6-dideoxygalactose transaminase n=1 Tax=Amphritea atlantica TaxID=355243 RepID=A0ABY5GRZ9_9GAMM|nr:hypothetical protein KDX31_15385 [Amphritea atlantica]